MKAYKLFRIMKDGEISPLFINKKARLPLNTWLPSESHRTKGYTYRPHWHCTSKPEADHLTTKGRAWYEIEIKDFTEMKRPPSQGGLWYLADNIKIIKQI